MQTRKWLLAGAGWLVVASVLVAVPSIATAQAVPPPPLVPTAPEAPAPPTTATEPGDVPPPPVPPAADDATSGQAEKDTGPVFEFGLRGEQKCIAPYTHGDAKTEEGKIDVTPDKDTLTVTATGGVGANVFFGVHSEAMQTFRLIQEFEVTCSDASVHEMVLTLDSKLLGFVRAKHKASACVRLASLTVTPAGSASPILSVSHPIPCVGGTHGFHAPPVGSQSTEPVEAVTSPPLPLGVYLLDANFILTATAEGFLDAHSTAIFSPEPAVLDPWEREHDPFVGEKKDGYGFTSVLTASTVGAPAVASEKTCKALEKRLAREKKARQMARQNGPRLAAGPDGQPTYPRTAYDPGFVPPPVMR